MDSSMRSDKFPARVVHKRTSGSVFVEVIQQETGAYVVDLWKFGYGIRFSYEEWKDLVGDVSSLAAQLQAGDQLSQRPVQSRIRSELGQD